MNVILLIDALLGAYFWVIFAYVILSWFPSTGVLGDVRRVLGSVCEPYLGLFRRFIPPIGMVDISPIVAILVLQVIRQLLFQL